MYILNEHIESGQQSIIFAATRYHVEYLHELLAKSGFQSVYIYGAMDQHTREERLVSFRKKYVNVLIVTDLAARGIDIPLLENVIHFDFPTKLKLFIHRSGRTARAGQSGTSYSLITPDELAYMHDLSIFVGRHHY
jgi:ATP-dependent RNA helicase DDX54/DBP10